MDHKEWLYVNKGQSASFTLHRKKLKIGSKKSTTPLSFRERPKTVILALELAKNRSMALRKRKVALLQRSLKYRLILILFLRKTIWFAVKTKSNFGGDRLRKIQ